jgi:5-methylcytosine-specific restriction protein A
MTGLPRPCLGCSTPVRGRSRCDRCQPPKAPTAARGYDGRWQALSRQARRRQPWCSDCGTVEDLTTDHLRWRAETLDDVDVVCRPCNSKRGPNVIDFSPSGLAMTPSQDEPRIHTYGRTLGQTGEGRAEGRGRVLPASVSVPETGLRAVRRVLPPIHHSPQRTGGRQAATAAVVAARAGRQCPGCRPAAAACRLDAPARAGKDQPDGRAGAVRPDDGPGGRVRCGGGL